MYIPKHNNNTAIINNLILRYLCLIQNILILIKIQIKSAIAMFKQKTFLLIYLFLIVGIIACNQDKKAIKKSIKEEKAILEKEFEIDDELITEFNKAKQIFYALPSPVEIAMLIKRAGTEFNSSLLNIPDNSSKYSFTYSKALNFGVYGADLSYASLFEQSQEAIKYIVVSKKLADEIGILEFMNNDVVSRMENNINNRDSTMNIITEVFMSSNDYLKESGRPDIAAIIIAGGWIEGLYIAAELAKDSPYNNELIDRIIDQKLSLTTLISLLESYSDKKDIQKILNLIKEIQTIYDKVQIVTSKVEPITDHESKTTTLQAKTEIFISDEIFKELCDKVANIRDIIVNEK